MTWHPDKHVHAGQGARSDAEAKFKAAKVAYEELCLLARG